MTTGLSLVFTLPGLELGRDVGRSDRLCTNRLLVGTFASGDGISRFKTRRVYVRTVNENLEEPGRNDVLPVLPDFPDFPARA